MKVSVSLHQRKTLLLVALFITFSAFTADILDLREELYPIPCQGSCLDDNVSTGETGNHPFNPEQTAAAPSVQRKASVSISIFHLLPYSFRAPPC